MNAAAALNRLSSKHDVLTEAPRREWWRWSAVLVLQVAFMAVLTPFAHAAGTASLPAYGADLQRSSVSGLQSGAFMAVQFDVAYSSRLIGAGIVAGGPFYCAGESPMISPAVAAVTLCAHPLGDTAPDAIGALRAARNFAAQRLIDDLANLNRQKIYVFSGGKDSVVSTRVVVETVKFYVLANVPAQNIQYQRSTDAGDALITDRDEDSPCGASRSPYINNCGFEQSHAILRWIYAKPGAPLAPPSARPTGTLLRFDQRAFDPNQQASLADVGYVYVPGECEHTACAVHVAFHGCGQDAKAIGDRFIRGTGYNEMADTNRIIVLYPQVAETARNLLACWDFWGYTSADPSHPDFATRRAPQIAAVMKMLQRLGEASR